MRVFESYGGLEFPMDVEFGDRTRSSSTAGSPIEYHIVERTDLFQDPEVMHESIELAFDPYVPLLAGS